MPDDIQVLIKHYRATMRSNARIRMLSTVIVVLIMSGHLLWLADRFDEFRDEGAARMVSALHDEFALVDPAIPDQAAQMFIELAPVYMSAIDTSFAEHRPALAENTHAELAQLDVYARKRFPEIQAGLADIIVDQEGVMREALTGVINEAEAERIVVQYGEAMMAKLQSLLGSDLKAHQEEAVEIGQRLERMAGERTQGASERIDSQELMGIMLELSGRNIRQSL